MGGTPGRRIPPAGQHSKHKFAAYRGNEDPRQNPHRQVESPQRRAAIVASTGDPSDPVIIRMTKAELISSYEEEKVALLRGPGQGIDQSSYKLHINIYLASQFLPLN